MKGCRFIKVTIMMVLSFMFLMSTVYASKPVWTFTPLTPTKITISTSSTTMVKYQVTNQSKKNHTLVMRPIQGVTQVTTSGNCPNPFVLEYQQSCTLNLTIIGSEIKEHINHGPVVCEHGNPLECYRPSGENSLDITVEEVSRYTVGGSVSDLSGTVVLQNNGGDNLTINANERFTFSTPVPSGASYNVTVLTQPPGQACTVENGQGTITNENVTNVTVTCFVVQEFTITPEAGPNGTITPSTSQQVVAGGDISFEATPNQGYAVNSWTLDGVAYPACDTEDICTLTNVITSHTLAVSFVQIFNTVTPQAGANGAITGSALNMLVM